MERAKFQTLDAARGVAAIAVMLFHYHGFLPYGRLLAFPNGYLAVDLFFVLSGFVIAYAYDDKLGDQLTVWQFFTKRLIRLLPMIWVGVAIGAVDALAMGERLRDVLPSVFLNALGLPNPVHTGLALFHLNGPQWSLFSELCANLVFAAAFPLLKRRGLIAVILLSALGLVFVGVTFGTLQRGANWGTIWYGFMRVGFSFFMGVLIFRTRASWAARLPRISPYLLMAGLAAVFLLPVRDVGRMIFDMAIVFCVAPIFVMCCAVVEPGRQAAAWAERLGRLSYPLYAIHHPIMKMMGHFAGRLHVSGLACTLATIAFTFVAALGLEAVYDRPIRSWLSSNLGRRRPKLVLEAP